MSDNKDDLIFQLYGIETATEKPNPTQSVSATNQKIFDLYRIDTEPSQGPVSDFVAGVSNIPRTVGNVVSEAFTGKPMTAPDIPRDSASYRAGEAFTNAVGAGTAAGITAGRVGRAPSNFAYGNPMQRAEYAARGFARDFADTFRRAPVRTSLVEGALGSTASLGGSLMAQKYPNSPEARAVGELLGGFTPAAASGGARSVLGLGAKVPGISWAIRQANEAYGNINLRGARRRVSNRLDRASPDREGAILAMEQELSPGARELMTPAMKTDSEGLMSLERAVFNAVDGGRVSQEFLDNYRAINDAIIADIRGSSSAPDIDAGRNRLNLELSRWGLFIDERIRLAAQNADDISARLSSSADNEQLSTVVRNNLNKALDDARGVENSLWGLVPNGVRIPTTNSTQTFNALQKELGKPQLDNLPLAAKKWLAQGSEGFKKYFRGEASIKDMRGLYSQLRAEARAARSGDTPNFDKARLSDRIADAVLEDMNQAIRDPSMEGYGPLQEAINYSRMLNTKFGNGAVGRILKMGANAGENIPVQLTLQNTIGAGGPKAGEVIDRILSATDNNSDARAAMSNYMRNLFLKSVRHGEGPINTTTGRTFIRNNEAALKRFPELKNEFNAAIEARDAASVAEKTLPKAMSHFDIATMYIERSPDKAWTEIINSRSSASGTRRLMSLARQDESGVAINQLRESFLEHVINNTKGSDGFIDPARLGEMLSSRSFREVQSELLTREQRAKWDRVLRTANRLDLRKTQAAHEGVLGDRPGMAANVLSRLLGGTIGRSAARAGVGGSIQTVQTFSNAFAKLAQAGIVDPAKRLIIDAVMSEDDELFKSLLDVRPNLPVSPEVQQRVNAWVAMTLYNLGNEE